MGDFDQIKLEVVDEDELANEEDVEISEEEPIQRSEEEKQQIMQLLTQLTNDCQLELQRTMTDQTPLSEICQKEVQEIFARNQAGSTQPPVELGPDPTVYIVAVLAIAFFAVGLKIYNISQELSKIPPKPVKKLSKKKEMKLKAKEQRNAQ